MGLPHLKLFPYTMSNPVFDGWKIGVDLDQSQLPATFDQLIGLHHQFL